MIILSIDTSCDETSVAVTKGRQVLSHVEYSQVATHAQWGGVVPSLAKRAHEERIDWVIEKTFQRIRTNTQISINNIEAVAVTTGPGLAIALEVGIRKAKEIASQQHIPVIPVNHMAGHIYSCFVQNKSENPMRPFSFPYLALLVSGGHTELVFMKDHHQFEVIGRTRDDAVGESLDKAARMLGFGYPGGPVIERMAEKCGNRDQYRFPRPMIGSDNLDFSYAGLKTSFLYFTKEMGEQERLQNIETLASSYQEAAFGVLVRKVEKAMKETQVSNILVGGGVAVNRRLRKLLRHTVKQQKGTVLFPPYRYLNFDNAAMISVAAVFQDSKSYVTDADMDNVDRQPRLTLG